MLSFHSPCRLAGWRSGPGTGNQQVAAELKIERRQLRVVALREIFDPLVGGTFGRVGGAEIQLNPAEQPLMLGNVVFAQRVERFFGLRRRCNPLSKPPDRRLRLCSSCSWWPRR